MAVSNSDAVLTPDKLNDLDRAILDYIKEDGRATPRVIQKALKARGKEPGVRQNVNSRLTRLAEHGHLNNVYDAGLYELVADPRDLDEGDVEIEADGGTLHIGVPCPWCEGDVPDANAVLTHLETCAPSQ